MRGGRLLFYATASAPRCRALQSPRDAHLLFFPHARRDGGSTGNSLSAMLTSGMAAMFSHPVATTGDHGPWAILSPFGHGSSTSVCRHVHDGLGGPAP